MGNVLSNLIQLTLLYNFSFSNHLVHCTYDIVGLMLELMEHLFTSNLVKNRLPTNNLMNIMHFTNLMGQKGKFPNSGVGNSDL